MQLQRGSKSARPALQSSVTDDGPSTTPPIVKRLEYLAKMRHSRDGMTTMDSVNPLDQDNHQSKTKFMIQGRGVAAPFYRLAKNVTIYPVKAQKRASTSDQVVTGKENITPSVSNTEPQRSRDIKSSKSIKSIKSVKSTKSDPTMQSFQLPALTIGSMVPTSAGDYIGIKEFPTSSLIPYFPLGVDYEPIDPDNNFEDIISMKLKRKKTKKRDKPETARLDESNSDGLNSCLLVRSSNGNMCSALNDIKKLKHHTTFMRRDSARFNQLQFKQNTPLWGRPKYNFNSVDSYLSYNKPIHRPNIHHEETIPLYTTPMPTPTQTRSGTQPHDTRLLKIMLEMNQPTTSKKSSIVYSDIAVHNDLEEYFQVKTPRFDQKSPKSKSTRSVKSPAHDLPLEEPELWNIDPDIRE